MIQLERWNFSPPFRGSFEPGTELFYSATTGHHGPGQLQRFSGLQFDTNFLESGVHLAHHGHGSQCMHPIIHRFLLTDVQCCTSDDYPVQEGDSGRKEGNLRNSESIRLRQVSELRSCSMTFSLRLTNVVYFLP